MTQKIDKNLQDWATLKAELDTVVTPELLHEIEEFNQKIHKQSKHNHRFNL